MILEVTIWTIVLSGIVLGIIDTYKAFQTPPTTFDDSND